MKYLVAAGLLAVPFLSAQDKPRLEFEVASVKASPPGGRGGGIKAQPGGQRYSGQNVPVKLMISLMYKVPIRQIEGGPDWINNEGFDVEAKADHSYSLDDLHVMFQNLLADRFQLKFHKEYREGPVYALSVDKSGAKMKVNDSPEPFDFPIQGDRTGLTIGHHVDMEYLCWWLGQVLQRDERPVLDRTGLKGHYDFKLSFAPELPPDFPRENLPPGFLDRPPIAEAVREQLGLKLQPEKGPVVHYVIDHVEKPGEN